MGAFLLTPGLEMEKAPKLVNPKAWSDWFEFCCKIGAPDFLVARGPTRAAMVKARKEGDKEREERILREFRAANAEFAELVRTHLFKNELILPQLASGRILYLCAGVEFGMDFARIAGKKGHVFLLDHAESITKYIQQQVEIYKSSIAPTTVLTMPARDIASASAKEAGLLPGSLDVVVVIRALHRVPPERRVQVLNSVQELLKPGGLFVDIELFENNRRSDRKATPGVTYWYLGQYKQHLASTTLAYDSGPVIQNQDDACRLVIFKKK